MTPWFKVLCSVAVVAAATTFTGVHEAQAAGRCGSSYSLSQTYYKANDSSDRVELEASLYYSSTTRRNCLVVAHYGSSYGQTGASLAQIRPSGYSWPSCNSVGCDKGNYAYYAGPVYTPSGVDMSHRCVDFKGSTRYDTYISKSGVHCG